MLKMHGSQPLGKLADSRNLSHHQLDKALPARGYTNQNLSSSITDTDLVQNEASFDNKEIRSLLVMQFIHISWNQKKK
jgi:hypothetical protein